MFDGGFVWVNIGSLSLSWRSKVLLQRTFLSTVHKERPSCTLKLVWLFEFWVKWSHLARAVRKLLQRETLLMSFYQELRYLWIAYVFVELDKFILERLVITEGVGFAQHHLVWWCYALSSNLIQVAVALEWLQRIRQRLAFILKNQLALFYVADLVRLGIRLWGVLDFKTMLFTFLKRQKVAPWRLVGLHFKYLN